MTESVIDLLCKLVRIDSTNPDLVPGGAGEGEIATFVGEWVAARGFEVHRLEERPGRPSVVAIHRGSGGGRSLMLNGHLDAVSLASYDGDGLDPERADGKLFGRGTFDMKGGVAAAMVAAATVAAEPHAGDILLALVADEEFASTGTEEALRSFTADAAIVIEPSGLDIVIAHRGFVWADVTIHGLAAHGSRRELGIDAIAKTGAFLTGLADLDRDLAAREPHPLLGTANVHASIIHGGEELSSYPASCTVSIERRTLPGETAESVEAELRAVLEQIAASDPEFRFAIELGLTRNPFAVDPDAPIVAAVTDAIAAQIGAPVTRGELYWTDCALLADAGIPTVLVGVDGAGAHAATEWVTEDSLLQLTAALTDAIRDSTGPVA